MTKPELIAHLREEHRIDAPEHDVRLDWLLVYHKDLHEEKANYLSLIPDEAWSELLRSTHSVSPEALARWAEEDRRDGDAKRFAREHLDGRD